jgi:hypothetical protein
MQPSHCHTLSLILSVCRVQLSDAAAAAAAPDAAAEEGPLVNGMTVEQRFQLCRSIGEECISGGC